MPDKASGSLSTADLLAQARCGDRQALDLLFARCRPYLNVVARTRLDGGLQPKVDVSDLVQMTLLEAFRDFGRFQGATSAEWLAWLRKITSRNALDQARYFRGAECREIDRERPLEPAGSGCANWHDPVAPGETPSAELMKQERELFVAAALDQLPVDYQEVIRLRNLLRLDFETVAQRMGRSRPAVQMLWTRALRKLQELLPGE